MKIFVTFLALLALGYSAPQPRKLFHEHYEDFIAVIAQNVQEDLNQLVGVYLEFEEFQAGLDYLVSPRFKNLIYEMEDLPEFKAVIDFLETHDIDILYFINEINEAVDRVPNERSVRQELSGRDVSSFFKDTVKIFPRDKLVALYNEKIANYDEFRRAMENFQSDDWEVVYNALWENEVFLREAKELNDNGIDIKVILLELRAIMGIYD